MSDSPIKDMKMPFAQYHGEPLERIVKDKYGREHLRRVLAYLEAHDKGNALIPALKVALQDQP